MPPTAAWLPAGALTDGPVRALLATAVDAWSAAWFADRAERATVTLLASASPPVEVARAPASPALDMRYAPAFGQTMIHLALDAEPSSNLLSSLDADLLRGFEHRLFADLAERLLACIGHDRLEHSSPGYSTSAPRRTIELVVTFDRSGDAIRTSVPAAALVAARKRMAQPARAHDKTLVTVRRALLCSRVSVSAMLGTAELALDQLSGLAVGDVIVLDRAVGTPVDLVRAGTDVPFAVGHLAEAGGILTVTLGPAAERP